MEGLHQRVGCAIEARDERLARVRSSKHQEESPEQQDLDERDGAVVVGAFRRRLERRGIGTRRFPAQIASASSRSSRDTGVAIRVRSK